MVPSGALSEAASARSIGRGLDRSKSSVRDDSARSIGLGRDRSKSSARDEGIEGYDYYYEDGMKLTLDPCPHCHKRIPTHLMCLHEDSSCCPSDDNSSLGEDEDESNPDDGCNVDSSAAGFSDSGAQSESDTCDEIIKLFSSLSGESQQSLLPKLQHIQDQV